MKIEKIDPDPFPPPCWQAPVTGVVELLARGGLNTHKSISPRYVRTFLTQPGCGLLNARNKYGLIGHIYNYRGMK